MFDLKFYALLNSIRSYGDNLNDYSKLRGTINNKDDYFNFYEDFFYKMGIDANTYTAVRMYIILCDMYFKDYDEYIVDKKYAYYKKSVWNGRQNRQLETGLKC